MPVIRGRDVRSLAFCVATILLVYALATAVFGDQTIAAPAAAAYAAFILTRPRMIRVYRRLRGERLERSGYYKN